MQPREEILETMSNGKERSPEDFNLYIIFKALKGLPELLTGRR